MIVSILCVYPVMNWRLVWDVPCLSAYVSRDRLQTPAALNRSSDDRWMDRWWLDGLVKDFGSQNQYSGTHEFITECLMLSLWYSSSSSSSSALKWIQSQHRNRATYTISIYPPFKKCITFALISITTEDYRFRYYFTVL